MPRLAANLSTLFPEVPFLDRFALAAACGFRAVEIQFPYAVPATEIARRLGESDLTLVMFNLPPGDWEKGERGLACLPGREHEFRDGVARAVAYARELGVRMVNCLAGVAPPAGNRSVRETLVANLHHAATALAAEGMTLLVEAVNTHDVPGFYLSRGRQVIDVIDDVGLPNLALQYDVYHMRMMNEDLRATIRAALPRIAHLQVSDVPGRHEPGTGDIDFGSLLPWLDEIGYGGWVGCEYVPAGDTREGLGWARQWLQGGA